MEVLIMNSAEYGIKMAEYLTAKHRKSNLSRIANSKSKRFSLATKEKAAKILSELEIPKKPKRPIGYQIYCDGDYLGFSGPISRKAAIEEAIAAGYDAAKITLVPEECWVF